MGTRGFEPPSLAARAPQARAYASSATSPSILSIEEALPFRQGES